MLTEMASKRLFVADRPTRVGAVVELSQLVTLPLARLSRCETEAMIRGVAPDLPAAMVAQSVAKTDGVPLFIEELTKSVAESRVTSASARPSKSLRPCRPRFTPVWIVWRRSGQSFQVAALLGRVFDADLLIAASQRDAAAVKRACTT